MQRILQWGLKNRVVVILITVLIIVAGAMAATGIRMEKYPDVEMPTLVLQVKYPNHSAEEVERDITLQVEKAIENVKAYEDLTSQTRENGAIITVSYEFGEDMDKMEQSIQAVVSSIGLPSGVEVAYKRISADAQPVYKLALASDASAELEKGVTDELLPDLQKVKGVSSVNVGGMTEQQLDIVVNKQKAAAYGISLSDIRAALEQSEYILPLGTIEENQSRITVGMEGSLKSSESLQNVAISVKQQQADATPASVRLGDIADLHETENADMLTRYNGKPAILLEVYKSQDSNTAEVVNSVKEQVNHFHPSVDYKSYTLIDQGKDVEDSVSSMLKEGGFGALFTIVVILLFLRNLRATLIAVISLPVSILGTIYVLQSFGLSLNIMTLGGIAVSVGRIVDDSIVVIENIFRWLRKEPNMSKLEIMLHATKEVAGAVTSSTVATVVIFLPLAFVQGIVGEFFRPFSVAVVTSILISLVVAFLLIPALAIILFRRNLSEKREKGEGRLGSGYGKMLSLALKYKSVVIVAAILLLVGSGWMAKSIEKSFLPSEPANALNIQMELPEGTDREKMDTLSRKVEKQILANDQIADMQVSIGQNNEGLAVNSTSSGDNKAQYYVQLKDGTDITSLSGEFQQMVKEEMKKDYPTGTVRVKEVQKGGPPSGNTIEITLYGNDPVALRNASNQLYKLMTENGQLKNISGGAQPLQTKYSVVLKDQAKMQGISPYVVYQQVNEQLQPQQAGSIQFDDRQTAVDLQYDGRIAGKSELLNIKLMTSRGIRSLGEIADVNETTAPLTIQHQNGKMAVKLTAESSGADVGKVASALENDLDALALPKGINWEMGGGQKLMSDGFSDLGTAMALAVGLVFIVLSITFGGVLTPIVILSSLIFVPFGSLGALLISGETLSMSGMIGMLMLIGIVVTNAVVLLERIETERRSGMDLKEAILEACGVRLRPILMTALATVFALLPLALSHSGSGVISKGLAIAVIGGLFISTLLTLVFIPVLYSILGKWKTFTRV